MLATTSILRPSAAGRSMLRSRRGAFVATRAPASRQIRAACTFWLARQVHSESPARRYSRHAAPAPHLAKTIKERTCTRRGDPAPARTPTPGAANVSWFLQLLRRRRKAKVTNHKSLVLKNNHCFNCTPYYYYYYFFYTPFFRLQQGLCPNLHHYGGAARSSPSGSSAPSLASQGRTGSSSKLLGMRSQRCKRREGCPASRERGPCGLPRPRCSVPGACPSESPEQRQRLAIEAPAYLESEDNQATTSVAAWLLLLSVPGVLGVRASLSLRRRATDYKRAVAIAAARLRT